MSSRPFALCILMALSVASADVLAEEAFATLAKRCAPNIAPDTLKAIVQTESAFNPYAIGVVGGAIAQPKSFQDAMIAIAKLETDRKNYSVGLAQINKNNFKKYGIDAQKALDACTNLNVAGQILGECFSRANKENKSKKTALTDALSCYYSGNFKTGYEHGYVDKVKKHALETVSVPSLTQTNEQDSLVESSRTSSPKLIF